MTGVTTHVQNAKRELEKGLDPSGDLDLKNDMSVDLLSVSDADGNQNQENLRQEHDAEQRCQIFIPLCDGDFHNAAHHAHHSGPENIGIAVAKLECQNGKLAA